MDATSISPRYEKLHGASLIRRFNRTATLRLATDNLTIQYHARVKLLADLLAAFDGFGIPSQFYNVMAQHDAVVSGSFVLWFLDQFSSQADVHDIDIFIARGKLDDFLLAIHNLPPIELVVLSSTTRPGAHDPTAATMGQDITYYDNAGIQSVVRLRVENTNGKFCNLDIVESVSASPFSPILYFDLSHLRVALSSNGLFEFHPDWHQGNKSYVGPNTVKLNQKLPHPSYIDAFFKKYLDRGYILEDLSTSAVAPANDEHICYRSFSCPLTVRRTTDDGVRFVPFTETAAVQCTTGPPTILTQPPLQWRHGGRCFLSLTGPHTPQVSEEEWCESGSPIY